MPPKYYANVCDQMAASDPSYSDYENFEVKFQAQDNYQIIKKIGRGKYSEVYEGINTLTNQRIVIKILKPGKFFVEFNLFFFVFMEKEDLVWFLQG